MLLTLRYDGPLSNFAFNFNLRRYIKDVLRRNDELKAQHAVPRDVFDKRIRHALEAGPSLEHFSLKLEQPSPHICQGMVGYLLCGVPSVRYLLWVPWVP